MSKLISVSDDVYKNLKKMKGNESYSKLLRSMIENKSKTNKEKVLSFAGTDGIDSKRISNLEKMWKKWQEKYA